MRKPLTVTFSVVCTLKSMSRWSIQRIKAMLLYMVCLSTLSIWRSKHANALNAIFVKTVDIPYTEYYELWKLSLLCIKWPLAPQYKTHLHVSTHNFLNIQLIFNPQKVLEIWDWGIFNHTINAIYVDTVDTGQGSLMLSMLSLLTLSIQNTSTHFCP